MASVPKTVLVVGAFDLFHRGHLELLLAAKALGERLVVIVNGDEFTTRYKRAPIFDEQDRLAIVSALACVDVAMISNSADVRPVIEEHGIDLIVHGDDWAHEDYMRQIRVDDAYLADRSIEMRYLPYYSGISTSMIIDRIRAPRP